MDDQQVLGKVLADYAIENANLKVAIEKLKHQLAEAENKAKKDGE